MSAGDGPLAESGDHGPDPHTWFGIGLWPTCTCGYAPRDNGLLTAHWREHGFEVVDNHGTLVRRPVNRP